MCSRGEGGFTLLETLLALAVTMFVLSAAMRLLSFTSASAARAVVRGELTDCARTAADVLTVNMERADEINITTVGNNTLKQMDLLEKQEDLTKPGALYSFAYDIAAAPKDASYHRLKFGGVELASNLADIRVWPDGSDTLIIEIQTDTTLTVNADTANKRAKVSVDPVIIQVPVNITGKAVTIH